MIRPAIQNRRRTGSSKGLQPKIIKSNRTVKGRRVAHKLFHNTGTAKPRITARTGSFRIVSLGNRRISANQLEAARKLMKKVLNTKGVSISITAYTFAPVTRRPADVRMGKGKGTRISRWICPVKAGQILFDLFITAEKGEDRVYDPYLQYFLNSTTRSALEKVKTKLPVPIRIIRTRQ